MIYGVRLISLLICVKNLVHMYKYMHGGQRRTSDVVMTIFITLETGSLSEPGTSLVASKPQGFSCLRPLNNCYQVQVQVSKRPFMALCVVI